MELQGCGADRNVTSTSVSDDAPRSNRRGVKNLPDLFPLHITAETAADVSPLRSIICIQNIGLLSFVNEPSPRTDPHHDNPIGRTKKAGFPPSVCVCPPEPTYQFNIPACIWSRDGVCEDSHAAGQGWRGGRPCIPVEKSRSSIQDEALSLSLSLNTKECDTKKTHESAKLGK